MLKIVRKTHERLDVDFLKNGQQGSGTPCSGVGAYGAAFAIARGPTIAGLPIRIQRNAELGQRHGFVL